MKHGSLFAGIGGFDLGFERAGIETAWQVEIDKNCNAVLEKHWPDVERHEDVREVGRNNLEPVDVISGGFPCQDVSNALRAEGLGGRRSVLWFEFHRVIRELKPRWVVIENVPGLLSSNDGCDFATILRGLEKCGYYAAWRVLNSEYFGVPQRRRRLYIVASLGSATCAQVLFEPEPNQEPTAEEWHTSAAPVFAFKKRGGYGWSESLNVALTIEAHAGTHTGGNESIPLVFTDGRPRWMTATEVERLQGFSGLHTKNINKVRRYRMMGNAVTVNVAEWIGKRLMVAEVPPPGPAKEMMNERTGTDG